MRRPSSPVAFPLLVHTRQLSHFQHLTRVDSARHGSDSAQKPHRQILKTATDTSRLSLTTQIHVPARAVYSTTSWSLSCSMSATCQRCCSERPEAERGRCRHDTGAVPRVARDLEIVSRRHKTGCCSLTCG